MELVKKMEESIQNLLNEGLNTNNLDTLYKLTKIKHMAKEDENMNYGNYNGRNVGYDTYGRDNYGRYDNYNARGYDRKYRGHEDLDRMSTEYGRYMENRERYGANDDTKRSLKYMLESMEDFARKLRQDAQSQEEVQMIRDTAQKIAQM
jgi:hypothetical protein